MSQLRSNIERSNFVDRVQQQMKNGYQLVSVIDKERSLAVAGFRIAESLAWGKFLYIEDLVVDELSRSQKYGQILFQWLVDYAKQHQCKELHLDSGVQRFDAHRFYLRQRMKIASHHFSIDL